MWCCPNGENDQNSSPGVGHRHLHIILQWFCFVSNRVSTIVQCAGLANWFHLDTHDNPADLATRGIAPQDLVQNDLWWEGPGFLSKDPSPYAHNEESLETEIEKTSAKVHVFIKNFEDFLDRFSNLSRALRVLSYAYRFIHRTCCKFKSTILQEAIPLTKGEIPVVKERLIIISQTEQGIPMNIKKLFKQENLPFDSQLLTFNPVIAAKGIMRASGRLVSTPDMSYDERHSIILPYKIQLSRLLIQFTHDIKLHGGNKLMHRLIRLQFAIPRVKNLNKPTIHRCKICVIHRQKVKNQLMGILPVESITISFSNFFRTIRHNELSRSWLPSLQRICRTFYMLRYESHLSRVSNLTSEKKIWQPHQV